MEVPSSFKFKWRIKNISTLDEENYFSPVFTIGPHKWKLLAFRRGCKVDDYLSAYVVAVECTNTPVYARFSLAVVGQTNNTMKKDTEDQMFRFTKDESDWGFDDFIMFRELIDPSNGYIVDDACTIEVELCLKSTEDSIEDGRLLMLCPNSHSGLKFSRKKTKKRKKPAMDNSSPVQVKEYSKMKIIDLQNLCKEKGIPAPETKAALIEALSGLHTAETSNSNTLEGRESPESSYVKYRGSCLGPLCEMASDLKKVLTDEHLKALENFPFWNMYRPFHEGRFTGEEYEKLGRVAVGLRMILDFVIESRKNKESKCFKFTPEQLAVIFGLQRIQESDDMRKIKTISNKAITNLSGEYQRFYIDYLKGGQRMDKMTVKKNLRKTAKNPSKVKEFIRLLTMYLCMQVFFSDSTGSQLPKSFVPLVFEPEKVSWPDRIHEYLMDLIDKCEDSSKLFGCTIYLVYWFAEHFVKTGKEHNQVLPRFLRWNTYDITQKVKDGLILLPRNSDPSSFMSSLAEQESNWANKSGFSGMEKAELSEVLRDMQVVKQHNAFYKDLIQRIGLDCVSEDDKRYLQKIDKEFAEIDEKEKRRSGSQRVEDP